VIAQATGFAILAALSPTALLVMTVFLGSERPRETALAYVAGAMIMTVLMAVTVLLVLRGLNLGRLTARPRPGVAFAAGLILFLPSATFVAAVQVIATSDASKVATAVALIIVVAISALIVWAPLIGYLARPDDTVRLLRQANGWLRVHGRTITVYGLLIGGIALIINGALGVASS